MLRGNFLGLIGGSIVGVFAAQACGDTASGDDCTIGARGCECTVGGACDPGLSCIDGLCIFFGDSSSMSNPSTTAGTGTESDSDPPSTTATTASTTMSPDTGATEADATDDGPKLDVGRDDTGPPKSGCTAIDILFVLDSSASMIGERQALSAAQAFTQIIDALEGINGGGVDYRIGVTDDNDAGFQVPPGWAGVSPWFDSSELDANAMTLAFNGAVAQIGTGGGPSVGCEHVLTSATDLLVGEPTGFVRPEALLVLVMLTDVDDYGAYDQPGGNVCGIGCQTPPPYDVAQIETILSDDVKGGQVGAVAAIVVAGDPSVDAGVNICQQPGSCGCAGGDCAVFHADRLYAFASLLGANGVTADFCLVGGSVAETVEGALTENIDLACINFEPEG